MSDIVNKELKERYDLYDKIISSCMVNFYSFSKDNDKIILRDFFSKSNKYLFGINIEKNNNNKLVICNYQNKSFAFEVAKLVNAIYPNKQIYIDMPFIQYIFFKIKNRKVKLKHIKKCEEVDNALNIEDMLDFVADSYGVEFSIFAEIYETYWNRKDNINV